MPCSTPPAARPGCRSITAAASASATRSTPASSSCATAPPPPAASSACCGTIRRAGSCGMRTPATRARSSVPARSTSTCRSCKAERQERMSEPLKLWRNAQLATCDAAARVIARGALTTRAGRIEWVGEEAALPAAADEVHDLAGAWVTPGLIDCHTHLVFAGTRANEYAERLRGRSYEEIARAGGGILATVRAVRAASEEQLFDESAPRLAALLAEGVTTVEIKSGYGLTLADEAKMLRVIRQRQAVAGFDLHRGDALGEQRRQPWRALIEQLFLARRTHRTHGGEDAAAGARDLLVRAPAQPLGVLVGARAGEHQVRMTVDQPGCDPGTRQIMYLIRRRRERRFLPHPLDAPGAGRERTARDDARRGVAGRELRVAPQLERFGHALLPLSLAGTAG